MAFQLKYQYLGIPLPESYWRLSKYEFSRTTGLGSIEFSCYPSKAARDESLGNFIPNAQRTYTIPHPMTEAECYDYALSIEDVGEPAKSFFDGAINV